MLPAGTSSDVGSNRLSTTLTINTRGAAGGAGAVVGGAVVGGTAVGGAAVGATVAATAGARVGAADGVAAGEAVSPHALKRTVPSSEAAKPRTADRGKRGNTMNRTKLTLARCTPR